MMKGLTRKEYPRMPLQDSAEVTNGSNPNLKVKDLSKT